MEVNNPVCKEDTLPGISKQGLKLKKKQFPRTSITINYPDI